MHHPSHRLTLVRYEETSRSADAAGRFTFGPLLVGTLCARAQPPLIVLWVVRFATVLLAPVLHNRIGRLAEPFLVTFQILQGRGQEKLLAVGGRMSQGPQQADGYQNGNLVRRKAEEPATLLFSQAAG